MKRYALHNLLILVVLLQSTVISRCQILANEQPMPGMAPTSAPTAGHRASPVPSPTAESEPLEIERRVGIIVSRMTLEQKVGQLFVISFKGTTVTSELQEAIQDWPIGGILIFGPNVSSLPQLRALVS